MIEKLERYCQIIKQKHVTQNTFIALRALDLNPVYRLLSLNSFNAFDSWSGQEVGRNPHLIPSRR